MAVQFLCHITYRYTESLNNLTYLVGAEGLTIYNISTKLPHSEKSSAWVKTPLSRSYPLGDGAACCFHTYVVAKCLVPKWTS